MDKKLKEMIDDQINNRQILCSYLSWEDNRPYFICLANILNLISNSVPYSDWVWNEQGSVIFDYEENGHKVKMTMDNVSYLEGSAEDLMYFAEKYAVLEETDYYPI